MMNWWLDDVKCETDVEIEYITWNNLSADVSDSFKVKHGEIWDF